MKISIVHIINRLDIGGLETVLVQFLNNCPEDKFLNTIIVLTESTEFSKRITNYNVKIINLYKKKGKSYSTYFLLWKFLSSLKPDIVHTYNLPTLDCQVVAFLSGVKHRIHAEHGRYFEDQDGSNLKYNFLRKLLRPVIHRWVAVSNDLYSWLLFKIKINKKKCSLIYNGVDTNIFHSQNNNREILPTSFQDSEYFILGTVGRLDPVKNHAFLLKSIRLLIDNCPNLTDKFRLIIVGDGPIMQDLKRESKRIGLDPYIWFSGARHDIPDLLNCMDLFILPSLAEGTPMTILEAMATGLPVIATRVGGNSEIVEEGVSGLLIDPSSPSQLVEAIKNYILNKDTLEQHGLAGKKIVENKFTIDIMTYRYISLYKNLVENINEY